jgi:23S rRNA pseudouridine1911/1915/1917 synthase
MYMQICVAHLKQSVRFDMFLARCYGVSRSVARRLIEGGHCAVNAHIMTKSAFGVVFGDVIDVDDVHLNEVRVVSQAGSVLVPDSSISFNVIYEDAHIVVINKPAGLVVHPGTAQTSGTLAHGLIARYPDIVGVGESSLRPGIVHRLDKDTSGVMVVARDMDTYRLLKHQFQSHSVKKHYIALVHGRVKDVERDLHHWLIRSEQDPKKYVAYDSAEGLAGAREAALTFRVHTYYDGMTLVDVYPKTGRKHQIRAQFARIGHPVVGDWLYAFKDTPATELSRQFLHAASLTIDVPGIGERQFEARLAPDLQRFLSSLSLYS